MKLTASREEVSVTSAQQGYGNLIHKALETTLRYLSGGRGGRAGVTWQCQSTSRYLPGAPSLAFLEKDEEKPERGLVNSLSNSQVPRQAFCVRYKSAFTLRPDATS